MEIINFTIYYYYALQNIYNNDNDIILWDHRNPILYLPNKKHPITSEYFIWSHDQLISRAKVAKNFYIDGTFHHPKNFSRILIIIIKDVIINEYIPCFYILMSHRNEILYTLVFQSINNILTQNRHYELNLTTITTDAEKALINGINNIFTNITLLSCWIHLK